MLCDASRCLLVESRPQEARRMCVGDWPILWALCRAMDGRSIQFQACWRCLPDLTKSSLVALYGRAQSEILGTKADSSRGFAPVKRRRMVAVVCCFHAL